MRKTEPGYEPAICNRPRVQWQPAVEALQYAVLNPENRIMYTIDTICQALNVYETFYGLQGWQFDYSGSSSRHLVATFNRVTWEAVRGCIRLAIVNNAPSVVVDVWHYHMLQYYECLQYDPQTGVNRAELNGLLYRLFQFLALHLSGRKVE